MAPAWSRTAVYMPGCGLRPQLGRRHLSIVQALQGTLTEHSPVPAASLPKAPGTARPRASTWGSATVSLLGAAAAAGAALPCSRALSAAAAPKLPPPLGSAGSPVQPLTAVKHACILYPMYHSMMLQQVAPSKPCALLLRFCKTGQAT